MRRFDLRHYQSMKIKMNSEYIIKLKHEVLLFKLERQSSKKLSSSGVLLSIE